MKTITRPIVYIIIDDVDNGDRIERAVQHFKLQGYKRF